MKFFDIVLEEPFSRKLHGVQIKAACSLQTYEKYVDEFLKKYSEDFSTFFFAVHTPSSTLEKHIEKNEKVKILDIKELSGLVISSGLVDWVLDKTK
jgi:menaquinone-dependent protoporphyrinogen IX oxidase